jgi:cation-transporting P-type ATPase 13A2
VVRFFDLMTTAVPPGLPACLAVAVAVAVWRLRRAAIFVTAPHKIVQAGRIDTLCFDKTGETGR